MKTSKTKGFTLLEAMIVVALLGILATMAYPSFKRTINNNRMSSARTEITKALAYSRSEAISRNQAIGLCPMATGNSDNCGTKDNWANGFIVFVDNNNNNALDSGEDILQYYYLKQPIGITIGDKSGYIWRPGGLSLKTMDGSTTNANIIITPTSDSSNTTNQSRICTITQNGRVLCP